MTGYLWKWEHQLIIVDWVNRVQACKICLDDEPQETFDCRKGDYSYPVICFALARVCDTPTSGGTQLVCGCLREKENKWKTLIGQRLRWNVISPSDIGIWKIGQASIPRPSQRSLPCHEKSIKSWFSPWTIAGLWLASSGAWRGGGVSYCQANGFWRAAAAATAVGTASGGDTLICMLT